MRQYSRRSLCRSILLAFALGATGCSTSSTSVSASGEVVGYPVFDETEAYARSVVEEQTAQERIAQCMKAEGFDYRPEPTARLNEDAHDAMLDPGYGDKRFAENFGFGLTTVQDFKFGEPTSEELAQIDADIDSRFDELYGDMSPELQVAYFETLYGKESDDENVEPTGCIVEATEGSIAAIDNYIDLLDEINEAKSFFSSDPRVVDFYEPWADCMRSEGLNYATPLLARKDHEDKFREAMRSQNEDLFLMVQESEIRTAVLTVSCGHSPRNFLHPDLGEIWLEYADDIG